MSAIDALRPLAFALLLLCVLGLGACLGVAGLLWARRRAELRDGAQAHLVDGGTWLR